MSLPTFEEASAKARQGLPFSNGTEGDCWMEANCGRCIHDKPARHGRPEDGCPLVLVAYMGRTPAEWIETSPFGLSDRYTCVMFRSEDDPGPDEPAPIPDPPGQLVLCERKPYERPARMFIDTGSVKADALTPS